MDTEIGVTNTKLVLPEGAKLAMIDENGNVMVEGEPLEKELFSRMGKALARVLVEGSRVLTKSETQIYSRS